jgi:hypothetical protein
MSPSESTTTWKPAISKTHGSSEKETITICLGEFFEGRPDRDTVLGEQIGSDLSAPVAVAAEVGGRLLQFSVVVVLARRRHRPVAEEDGETRVVLLNDS